MPTLRHVLVIGVDGVRFDRLAGQGWLVSRGRLAGRAQERIARRLDVTADTAHLPVPDGGERRLLIQHPDDRPQLGLVQAFGGGIGQVLLPG